MMAQAAALKEATNSKLRRLMANNKSVNCAGVAVGYCVLFYMTGNRKSAPRWRGPAEILNIDETRVIVKLLSRTFQVGRYCVRKMEKEDVSEVEWLAASGTMPPGDGSPLEDSENAQKPRGSPRKQMVIEVRQVGARHRIAMVSMSVGHRLSLRA